MRPRRRRDRAVLVDRLEPRVALSRMAPGVIAVNPASIGAPTRAAVPSGGHSSPYLDRLFDGSSRPQASIEGTDVGGPGDTGALPEDFAVEACFPPDEWDPNAPEPNSTEPEPNSTEPD